MPKPVQIRFRGFTLSELLVALSILGVIATFTIPKVLQSQQDGKYKAVVKEAAGYMSEAYQAYILKNGKSVNAGIKDLTPYLNYVSIDTTTEVDNEHGDLTPTFNCGVGWLTCFRLHNGAMLYYATADYFSGANSTNAVWFNIDPDGKATDGTTNGPGKSITLWIHYDGRLKDRSGITPQACDQTNCYGPDPTMVPPWFSWN